MFYLTAVKWKKNVDDYDVDFNIISAFKFVVLILLILISKRGVEMCWTLRRARCFKLRPFINGFNSNPLLPVIISTYFTFFKLLHQSTHATENCDLSLTSDSVNLIVISAKIHSEGRCLW